MPNTSKSTGCPAGVRAAASSGAPAHGCLEVAAKLDQNHQHELVVHDYLLYIEHAALRLP